MAYPSRLFIGLGFSIAGGWPNNSGNILNWYRSDGTVVCGATIICSNEVIPCL